MNADAHVPPETAAVITVSDRCANGVAVDVSGPLIVAALREHGLVCSPPSVVEDGIDPVQEKLYAVLNSGHRVVVTTGGTGVHPRDLTPEATAPLLTRDLPGLAEAIRQSGLPHTPSAVLSRGRAGIAIAPGYPAGALVVNLPGSSTAVREGLAVLLPLLPHILSQLRGDHH